MAVNVDFKMQPASGSAGNNTTIDVGFIINGTSDFNQAVYALKSFAPLRLGPLYAQEFKASPITPSDWDGTVTYGTAKPTDESTYSVEIGVTGAHFTQSLQTIASFARPGDPNPPPNYGGAIGATKDGVDGCDVQVPNLAWTEHHLIDISLVTQAYILTIFNCTARMNQSQFRLFAQGEALLMGCTLALSQDRTGWAGDFRFIGSPNASNIQVGAITVTQKLGHDYLWVRYNDSKSNGSTVKIPKNVFIERVYQFADFDSLQLDDPT